jgi:hypothetical protein
MSTTKQTRSPFLIFEEALSPMQCEEIIQNANFLFPDVDKHNVPVVSVKHTELAHTLITQFLDSKAAEIEAHYQNEIVDYEPTRVLWSDSSVAPNPVCDNSSRIKGKWLRIHNRDITAVVFLSDYNETPPFDGDFEVYGGKMEFPTWGFGFNPQRGTMVVYPSDPHFTHVFSQVEVGDLYATKTFVSFKSGLLFQPSDFPGTYVDWLKTNF